MLNRCVSCSAPVILRKILLSSPLLGDDNSSQAMAPRNSGVTNEAVTSARMTPENCRSVRATSQPIGATTVQQITAEDVAMMKVVTNGSKNDDSVNSR